MAKLTGPSIFGFISISIVLAGIFLDVIDYGASSFLSRELSAGRIDRITYWFGAYQKIGLVSFFSLCLTIPVFFYMDRDFFSLLIGIYPVLWLQMSYIQHYLLATENFDWSQILQIIEKTCAVSLLIILGHDVSTKTIAFLPLIVGLSVHCVVGYFLARPIINISYIKQESIWNVFGLFKKSRYFGRTSVLTDVVNLDSSIIAISLTLSEAGSYSIMQKLRNPLTLGFQSFSTRIRPTVAKGSYRDIRAVFIKDQKFLFYNIVLIITIAVFFITYASEILGESFPELNLVLFLGTLTAIPSSFSAIFSSFLVASGLDSLNSRIIVLFVPIVLISIILSSQFLGLIGVTILLFIINFGLSLFYFYFFMRAWRRLKSHSKEI